MSIEIHDKIHPTNWTCPNPECRTRHSKPHWADYHQKEPGWKDKLDKHGFDKASDPNFQIICEICGSELIEKPQDKDAEADYCPKCEASHKIRVKGILKPNFCPICGTALTIKPKEKNYCKSCNTVRKGIPAPLLCPHCGWTQERVILLKVP